MTTLVGKQFEAVSAAPGHAPDRFMSVLTTLFRLCAEGDPPTPGQIAVRYAGSSHQEVTAILGRLRAAQAARFDSGPDRRGWKPTEPGVAAMREHYRDWADHYSPEYERKALA